MVWAGRFQKWERAREALCKEKDERGFPAYFRGYLLSEALVRLLEKFNPETEGPRDLHSVQGSHANAMWKQGKLQALRQSH